MKIESKIKRKGGSEVPMGSETYQFVPDAKGRHVASVTNSEHIDRFLSIPEGYHRLDDMEDEDDTGNPTGEGPKEPLSPVEQEAARLAAQSAMEDPNKSAAQPAGISSINLDKNYSERDIRRMSKKNLLAYAAKLKINRADELERDKLEAEIIQVIHNNLDAAAGE